MEPPYDKFIVRRLEEFEEIIDPWNAGFLWEMLTHSVDLVEVPYSPAGIVRERWTAQQHAGRIRIVRIFVAGRA